MKIEVVNDSTVFFLLLTYYAKMRAFTRESGFSESAARSHRLLKQHVRNKTFTEILGK